MTGLTIGQLANRARVNVETIRYYERRGLVPAPPRRDSVYRQFPADFVQRIQFIKRAQELGFSLKEVADLLALRAEGDGHCADIRKRAEAKVADVEHTMRDLERIRNALRGDSRRHASREVQPDRAGSGWHLCAISDDGGGPEAGRADVRQRCRQALVLCRVGGGEPLAATGGGWGIVVWLLMMITPPLLIMGVGPFGVYFGLGLVVTTFTAHVVYGAVLGWLAERWACINGPALAGGIPGLRLSALAR